MIFGAHCMLDSNKLGKSEFFLGFKLYTAIDSKEGMVSDSTCEGREDSSLDSFTNGKILASTDVVANDFNDGTLYGFLGCSSEGSDASDEGVLICSKIESVHPKNMICSLQ